VDFTHSGFAAAGKAEREAGTREQQQNTPDSTTSALLIRQKNPAGVPASSRASSVVLPSPFRHRIVL
jgi:hypothetical protein